MKVELITHTPDPEKVVAAAAKLCYSQAPATDILNGLDDEKTQKFLNMLISLGHDSPMEHISFTFAIEGVSRSLLAQITRHRIASYSVKSQRYVTEGQFEFITPPEIAADEETLRIFNEAMADDTRTYNLLADKLKKRYIDGGMDEKSAEKKAIEDARYVLPNACETKMVVTMNARSLYNFFAHRLCERAQWEIRELADAMLMLVRDVCPTIFKKAGPPCAFGVCTEGKMSCGKAKEKRERYAR